MNVQLLVSMAKVGLDGLGGYEEGLGDLGGGLSFGGHRSQASVGGRQTAVAHRHND
jgi:hypothetical protein